MANKRRQYRLQPDPQELAVRVALTPSSSPLEGRILDLSAEGIKVLFKHSCDPAFPAKEVVNLKLASPHLRRDLVAPCRVLRCSEEKGGKVYGFRFLDWLGILSRLPPALACLFNRRHEVRAEPDPLEPVPLVVEGLLPEHGAVLRDISASGLSFVATSEAAGLLRKSSDLGVSLRLPGCPRRLTFRGRLLHKALAEGGSEFGLYFDPQATPRFREQQDMVMGYIHRRLRQLKRALAAQD